MISNYFTVGYTFQAAARKISRVNIREDDTWQGTEKQQERLQKQ
jgi:hypothetical protein